MLAPTSTTRVYGCQGMRRFQHCASQECCSLKLTRILVTQGRRHLVVGATKRTGTVARGRAEGAPIAPRHLAHPGDQRLD